LIGGDSRLEQRLDSLLAPRDTSRALHDWLAVWGVLVLMGFRYRLAFATRALLAAVAAFALWRDRPVVGAVFLVLFLTYLFQVPLIVGIVRGERDRRRGGRD
jgi:hypothetical protein